MEFDSKHQMMVWRMATKMRNVKMSNAPTAIEGMTVPKKLLNIVSNVCPALVMDSPPIARR